MTFGSLRQRPGRFGSFEDACQDETLLELRSDEGVTAGQALEADDAVNADAVDEGDHARQYLHLELDDQKRRVFDIDARDAGLDVRAG